MGDIATYHERLLNNQKWLPIESNPEVMNKFMYSCGLPEDKWEVSDVYGLDDALLALPKPVLSLMLLIPANEKYDDYCKQEATMNELSMAIPQNLYYMTHPMRNCCGAAAMIHAIANNLDQVGLKDDSLLQKFLNETVDKNPIERAISLDNDDDICATHNQVAQGGQTSAPNAEDQVDYHYVTFVENGGYLFELDAGKSSAINLGKTSKETFLADAANKCQDYMKRDPENMNFVVLALAAKIGV